MSHFGYPGLYIITHVATGHFYIGSTATFTRRKTQHVDALRNGKGANLKLQECFNKSPELSWEFIPTPTVEIAEEMEYQRISQELNNPLLCNFRYRDQNGNITYTQESLDRFSRAMVGKTHSEETKAKMSATRKGRTKDEDWLRKITLSQKRTLVEINGVRYESLSAAAKALGESVQTISYRVKNPNPKFANWKLL